MASSDDRVKVNLTSALYADPEPSVPDVDGNPIRVGQLVEHVHTGVLSWVHAVMPESGTFARNLGGRVDGAVNAGEHWRVVTETRRRPVPDTWDVTLRVVLTVPADGGWDSPAWRKEVEANLSETYGPDLGDGTMLAVTVEVVDDD